MLDASPLSGQTPFTTAEGGMIILKDDALAQKLRLLKAFGVNRTHGERNIPGDYDVVDLGYNYRMSEVHAAIGIEQIKSFPPFLQMRKENFISGRLLIRIEWFCILPHPSMKSLQVVITAWASFWNQNLSTKDRKSWTG